MSEPGGFLDSFIFSAGVAVTQIGRGLTFEDRLTPLPRTVRAGMAVHMGTHHGLQISLSADYLNIRHEDDYVTLGTEISLAQILTVRGGYNFEKQNLMRSLAVGVSFGLNDVFSPGAEMPALQNRTLRVDFATQQSSEFFRAPYQGSISAFPTGPEHFERIAPQMGDSLASSEVVLRWERAWDPDLYDTVSYWIIMDHERDNVAQFIEPLASNHRQDLIRLMAEPPVEVVRLQRTGQTQATLANLECGTYYWTVVAYDADSHFRLIGRKDRRIGMFTIAMPSMRITDLQIQQPESPDEPQRLLVTLENQGNGHSPPTALTVWGVQAARWAGLAPVARDSLQRSLILHPSIGALAPGAVTTVSVKLEGLDERLATLQVGLDKAYAAEQCDPAADLVSIDVRPPGADLAIAKLVDPDQALSGDTLKYALRVSNLGPAVARNAVIVDSLPAHLTLLQAYPAPDSVSHQGRMLYWNVSELKPGHGSGPPEAAFEVTYTARVGNIPIGRHQLLKLDSVVFNTNQDELTEFARRSLDVYLPELLLSARANPDVRIEIAGHTDSAGGEAYNQDLSMRRARRVRQYLVEQAPELADQLVAAGYGESSPMVPNRGPRCMRLNRRVEINLLASQNREEGRRLVNRAYVQWQDDPRPDNNSATATALAKARRQPEPNILQGVTFETGSAQLTTASQTILNGVASQLVDMLASSDSLCFEVEGHTDSVGKDADNLILSRNRARSVIAYLIDRCVWPERLHARGYGESRPIASNDTVEGRAENRRVVLTARAFVNGRCALAAKASN
ncbi:MAG: OmpA family protein [candidate division KSB1 bacterium]|nr:OmpA family protein [candidate division KSB1 bacterium]